MGSQQQPPFLLRSTDSDVEAEFESPAELVEYYHRYHRQTGEDLRIERAVLEFDAPEDGTLEEVLSQLETHFETEGVHLGVLVAAMSRQGNTVGETLEELHDARMTGALYQPQKDYFAVV